MPGPNPTQTRPGWPQTKYQAKNQKRAGWPATMSRSVRIGWAESNRIDLWIGRKKKWKWADRSVFGWLGGSKKAGWVGYLEKILGPAGWSWLAWPGLVWGAWVAAAVGWMGRRFACESRESGSRSEGGVGVGLKQEPFYTFSPSIFSSHAFFQSIYF